MKETVKGYYTMVILNVELSDDVMEKIEHFRKMIDVKV